LKGDKSAAKSAKCSVIRFSRISRGDTSLMLCINHSILSMKFSNYGLVIADMGSEQSPATARDATDQITIRSPEDHTISKSPSTATGHQKPSTISTRGSGDLKLKQPITGNRKRRNRSLTAGESAKYECGPRGIGVHQAGEWWAGNANQNMPPHCERRRRDERRALQ
jgi:hypothetical protein